MELAVSLKIAEHLIRYSLFRNLPCSTNNSLTIEADSISVALNISGVLQTIAPDILNVFWQDRAYYTTDLLHKIKFYILYGKCLFLLIHFLVAEDYELPKSTSHILSVLECVRILSSSICCFFYFNCLADDVRVRIRG